MTEEQKNMFLTEEQKNMFLTEGHVFDRRTEGRVFDRRTEEHIFDRRTYYAPKVMVSTSTGSWRNIWACSLNFSGFSVVR